MTQGTNELRRFVVGAAAGAVLLAGCSRSNDTAAVQAPPPVVRVAAVRQQSVPITEDFVGTTGAITTVELSARVVGTLESAPFKEGSLVHAGQIVFTLQRTPYEAALQSAEATLLKGRSDLAQAQGEVPVAQAQANIAQKQAQLDRANITVSRLTPLAAEKAVPEKDLDNALSEQAGAKAELAGALAQLKNAQVNQSASIENAKSEILSAQASVANAELNLSYTTIAAPVSGLIGFLKYSVGNVVGPPNAETLDTITTVDPIKVTFAVDENTYLMLAGRGRNPGNAVLRNQPVSLLLSNNTTYDHPGTLYTVNPTLDAKTGTITVEARFPNPNAVLRPGQFTRVRLVVENRPDALLVPQTAIVQTQGTTTAYVVGSDDTVALRSVQIGPAHGTDDVVLSGLRAGERVVVEGTQKVKPGDKVVVH